MNVVLLVVKLPVTRLTTIIDAFSYYATYNLDSLATLTIVFTLRSTLNLKFKISNKLLWNDYFQPYTNNQQNFDKIYIDETIPLDFVLVYLFGYFSHKREVCLSAVPRLLFFDVVSAITTVVIWIRKCRLYLNIGHFNNAW